MRASLNMRPCDFLGDAIHGRDGNAKVSRKAGVCRSLGAQSPNYPHLIGGQFGGHYPFTDCLTISQSHFPHVVGVGAGAQVPRITATRVVAFMENKQAYRDFPTMNSPTKAMRDHALSGYAKAAISSPKFGSRPFPAESEFWARFWKWAVFINILPKCLLDFLGGIGDKITSSLRSHTAIRVRALRPSMGLMRSFSLRSAGAFATVILLASCQGPKTFVMADGTKFTQTGHLGGKDFTQLKKTPAGGWTFTSRSDAEASFQAGVQAGLAAVGLVQAGLSTRARDAADASVAIAGTKAGVAEAAIAADVTKAGIAAETTKATFIPPP